MSEVGICSGCGAHRIVKRHTCKRCKQDTEIMNKIKESEK